MPKKKKTRKQKIHADSRRTTESAAIPQEQMQTYSVAKQEIKKPVSPVVSHNSHASIITSDYHYLSKDLLKTVLVTGAIIALEIVLHILTKGVS